jgi:hypothetical protein
MQEFLKLALLFFERTQCIGAILVGSAISARARGPLPLAHAVMVPATHSPTPDHESEDSEAHSGHHQMNPRISSTIQGWLSELIELSSELIEIAAIGMARAAV